MPIATHKKIDGISAEIPRESYIRQHLEDFLSKVHEDKDILVQGYQSLKSLSPAERELIFNPVRKSVATLSLFAKSSILSMKKWQSKAVKNNHFEICRVLTIKVKGETVGAVEFTIEADNRKCIIELMEVSEKLIKKHLGTILLHAAILVALLYQCQKIELFAVSESKQFYENNGFILESSLDSDHVLNFCNPISREKFCNKLQYTAPHYNIQNLLSVFETHENIVTPSDTASSERSAPWLDLL